MTATPRTGRATITEAESLAASALVADWRLRARILGHQLTTSQTEQLRAMIMGALADARDGATIPGERQLVESVVQVSGYLWRQSGRGDVEDSARAAVRRQWTAHLHRGGLRPLDWPAITVEFHRFPEYPDKPGATVPCEEHLADLVRFSIRGLAVAE